MPFAIHPYRLLIGRVAVAVPIEFARARNPESHIVIGDRHERPCASRTSTANMATSSPSARDLLAVRL